MAEQGQNSRLAVWSLLAGALTWGVLWYPYRVLASQGVGGVLASVLTYAVALALALLIWHRQLGPVRPSGLLLAIGLSGAACNLGYVLATLHGEVMRVLLLFYLAPLWTVLLARLWLGECLNRVGAGVVALSVVGAATMLWHPELGLPWPKNGAEWLGLGAGVLFACANVLSRKAESISIAQKSTAIFAGAGLSRLTDRNPAISPCIRSRVVIAEPNMAEAALEVLPDAVFQGRQVFATGMSVAIHRKAAFAAEQLVHRHAGALALDVPERLIESAQGVVQHRPVAPVALHQVHLKKLFAARDIFTKHKRLDVLFDGSIGGAEALGKGGAAQPIQARLGGQHLDDDKAGPRPGGLDQKGFYIGDCDSHI